jgi:ribosome biogenesis protein UTP30
MSSPHLEDNIKAICTQAPLKVPRKWSNIKSISIKTTSSVALPVYNKTLEELEEIQALAGTDAEVVNAEKDVNEKAEKADKEKKRKELAEKSPLARAVKKQKAVEKESAEDETTKTVTEMSAKSKNSDVAKTKSSKKHKEKLNTDESNANVLDTTTENAPMMKTTKEKKVKKKESDGAKTKSSEKNTDKQLVAGEDAPKAPEGNKTQADGVKSKISKKRKDKQTDNDSKDPTDKKLESSNKKAKESNAHGAPFIASKKYQGSQKGYVFRKDKQGIGYYLDELPVVDKEWLASLKRGGGKGGGRKSVSHTPNKRKGKSRISY